MYSKLLQKIVCTSLLGGMLFFGVTAESAVVTNRVPLLGYANKTISVYRAPGNMKAGNVAAETSLIQITQVRTDGWAYGSYALANGRRANGWFKMSDIQASNDYNNCNGTMISQQSVYRTTSMGAGNGIVSAGESVLVIGEQDGLAQIIYKQKNSANWRIGWVTANAVNKAQSTTQNKTSANTTSSSNTNAGKLVLVEYPVLTQTTKSGTGTASNRSTVNSNTINKNPVINPEPKRNRMKGDFDGDGKIGITDVSKINSHVIGLEKLSQEDLKIADINEDGKIDEDDVAIVKNVIIGMDSISNYKTNYSRWSKVAARTVSAYNEPSLKQKRDRNVNERVDKGDNITVYSETSNAYYVEYPAGNVKKKRWVSKDVFVAENNTTVTTNATNAATQGVNSATTTTKQAAQGANAGITAAMQAMQQKQENQTLKIVYPANGYYSLQPMCAPNTELSVQGAGTAEGTNVCISTIGSDRQTTRSHQKWYIERIGNTEWYKILAENSGHALNIHNGTAADWTNVSVWPYGGTMHQFRFLDTGNGYYVIQGNVNGTFVLDVYYGGTASGTNVQIYGFNNTASQKWKLVKRNAATEQPAPIFKQFTTTAKRTVNAFNDSSLSSSSWDGKSRVDYNDTITILKEDGNAYFVRYPIKTAPYYKEKWVTKDVLKEIPQGEFAWPVPGYTNLSTTYKYSGGGKHSCRYYSGGKGRSDTTAWGIDIPAPVGIKVVAPAGGIVQEKIDKGSASFGKCFEILHDDGTITLYAHLSNHDYVWNGKRVEKGDVIGLVGNTGKSDGAHLHFEMSNKDTYQYYKNKGIVR